GLAEVDRAGELARGDLEEIGGAPRRPVPRADADAERGKVVIEEVLHVVVDEHHDHVRPGGGQALAHRGQPGQEVPPLLGGGGRRGRDVGRVRGHGGGDDGGHGYRAKRRRNTRRIR